MNGQENFKIWLAVFALVAVLAGSADGRTLKVDRNCPRDKWPPEGSVYFSSIQQAIDHAVDGDEIAVWPGTYYEAIDFGGKAVLLYSTGEPDVTIIDASGYVHAVQCVNDEGPDTKLEGFTIARGNANGLDPNDRVGGGMYNYQTSPTVIGCKFIGNTASYGGGMYNYQSSPTIADCTFADNSAGDGAGMFNKGSDPTVINCTFSKNKANENAGGMLNDASNPIVSNCSFTGNAANNGGGMLNDDDGNAEVVNCTFSGNTASGFGGGMYNLDNSNPTVSDCNFIDNEAGRFGGGICNYDADPTVRGCSFSQNTTGGYGGAMRNWSSSPKVTNCMFKNNSAKDGGGMHNVNNSNPNLTNCMFSGNTTDGYGGAMWNGSSNPKVTNCTFTNNSAKDGGGMCNANNSNPKLTNCILWGETPDEIFDDNSSTTVTCSNIQGGWSGTGANNINSDPYFMDAARGDFRVVTATSPCVDRGDNGAPNLPETDLEGNPRVINGDWGGAAIVDMGAYEYQGPTTLLRVDITPQEAVDAGAAWRLARQKQWRDPNDMIYDLAPGYYDVEFRKLEMWSEPELLSVRVTGGVPVRERGEYKAIPLFDVGQIPPRDAPHGKTLKFHVHSEYLGPAASLSCTEPEPLTWGVVSFDDASGLYTYEPDDINDRRPFEVTFIATLGADANEQTVEIRPVPDLPPEFSIVSRATRPFPDPCSTDYLFVNETDLQDPCDQNTWIRFNAEKRATRSIMIGGKTVVLEAGSEHSRLYDDYHDNADINDIAIRAETVLIRDPLHLPQTEVTIHARDLVFEGEGSINTTPLSEWGKVHIDGLYHPEDDPVDGNDGHPAGNINLYIGSFKAGPGGGPRFIMNGGKGQNPEPGKDGRPGTDSEKLPAEAWPKEAEAALGPRPKEASLIETYHILDLTVRIFWTPYETKRTSLQRISTDGSTPTAGEDAVPAGKPGNGGAGGHLISTLALSDYVQSTGGQPGEAANYTHGENGTPNPAYKMVLHDHLRVTGRPITRSPMSEHLWYQGPHECSMPEKEVGRTLIYWAAPTLDAAPPAADVPVGPAGKVLHRPRPFAWLTPYALKMAVTHAKDAYLYGYAVEAHDILQEYYELLDTYMGLAEWSELDEQWRFEFEQMHHEIAALLHRLASGLDYFGNPPDWVPMLSFEVLKDVYEDEIDHAVRVLYLSYWLQNKTQELTETQDALEKGRIKLWEQTEQFRADYKLVAEIIGPLKSEAEDIVSKIGRADAGGFSGLLGELKDMEADLIKKANANVQARHELPTWKKWLGGLAAMAKCSLGWGLRPDPTTKAWGVGAGVVAGLDEIFLAEDDPWPVVSIRTDVAKQFRSIEFDKATNAWLENFDDIEDLSQIEEEGAEGYLDTMRSAAAKMASGLYDIKETLMTTSLSNEEVEAELKRIKADAPEFTKLVDEVTKLMVQKEVFNRRLAGAMQKVSTLSAGIMNNLLAIDAMNRQGSSISQILDPRAIMYIKDMEHRALERLQKYHYYMAKAYEYRLLKPYPKSLNIQTMFEAMQAIVSYGGTLGLYDFDALKGLYEDQLRDLTDDIIGEFMTGDYKYTWEEYYELSPEEVSKLNAGETVTLDFVDKVVFGSGKDNIRIVNLSASSMLVDVEGDPGSYGRVIVRMSHSGVSKIQDDDQICRFRHIDPTSAEKNLLGISWESKWDIKAPAAERVSHREMSDASKSLLASIFETVQDNHLLIARPSAWADIEISKRAEKVNADCRMDVNSLILRIDCDYCEREDNLTTLVVSAEPNGPSGMPAVEPLVYFLVNRADESGRQDGIGEFRRIYKDWNVVDVTVTAPETCGVWEFVEWIDQDGRRLTPSTTLDVGSFWGGEHEYLVRARYEYDGPLPAPMDFDRDFSVQTDSLQ